MAQSVLIKLTPGTLPLQCYDTNQHLSNDIIGQAIAELLTQPEGLLYNLGNATPAPDHRIWPWLRLNNLGYRDDWYVYVNAAGFWLAPYRVPPGPSNELILWQGTETSLKTYDGGEDSVVGLYTGPFWEADHTFDGRSPMGVGDIPNATPAHNLAVQENYGEGSHLQTGEEVGPHIHVPSPKAMEQAPGSGSAAGIGYFPAATGNPMPDLQVLANTYVAGQQKIPVIHPVRGVIFAKRTTRVYKRVNP